MLYLEKEYLPHNFVRSLCYTDKKGVFLCKEYTPQLQASTIIGYFYSPQLQKSCKLYS